MDDRCLSEFGVKTNHEVMDNEFTDSKNDPSTIHHFYHKLFRLKDNMNTKTGKELAVRRTEFMHLFVDEFLDEWNGKK